MGTSRKAARRNTEFIENHNGGCAPATAVPQLIEVPIRFLQYPGDLCGYGNTSILSANNSSNR